MPRDYSKCYTGFEDMLLKGDTYVSHLDAKTKKKAKDELHEDDKERESAVKQFRQWIEQQPHYKVCTDTTFLLQFLRRCKFSQLEARKMFDVFHSAVYKHVPEWMCNIDVGSSAMKKLFLVARCLIALPDRDEHGRRIFIWRGGAFDTDIKKSGYSQADVFGYVGVMFMILQREDKTQVNGYVIIQDLTGQTLKHTTFLGMEKMKHASIVFYNNFPARLKVLLFYNMGPFWEALITLISPFLSQKIKDRFAYFTTLEDVYKVVPKHLLPMEYLPDDYKGPNAGTLDELAGDFYRRITKPEVRARIKDISTNLFKVVESKRPQGGVQELASFRKLNVS